jgi:hypothetical protein
MRLNIVLFLLFRIHKYQFLPKNGVLNVRYILESAVTYNCICLSGTGWGRAWSQIFLQIFRYISDENAFPIYFWCLNENWVYTALHPIKSIFLSFRSFLLNDDLFALNYFLLIQVKRYSLMYCCMIFRENFWVLFCFGVLCADSRYTLSVLAFLRLCCPVKLSHILNFDFIFASFYFSQLCNFNVFSAFRRSGTRSLNTNKPVFWVHIRSSLKDYLATCSARPFLCIGFLLLHVFWCTIAIDMPQRLILFYFLKLP